MLCVANDMCGLANDDVAAVALLFQYGVSALVGYAKGWDGVGLSSHESIYLVIDDQDGGNGGNSRLEDAMAGLYLLELGSTHPDGNLLFTLNSCRESIYLRSLLARSPLTKLFPQHPTLALQTHKPILPAIYHLVTPRRPS